MIIKIFILSVTFSFMTAVSPTPALAKGKTGIIVAGSVMAAAGVGAANVALTSAGYGGIIGAIGAATAGASGAAVAGFAASFFPPVAAVLGVGALAYGGYRYYKYRKRQKQDPVYYGMLGTGLEETDELTRKLQAKARQVCYLRTFPRVNVGSFSPAFEMTPVSGSGHAIPIKAKEVAKKRYESFKAPKDKVVWTFTVSDCNSSEASESSEGFEYSPLASTSSSRSPLLRSPSSSGSVDSGEWNSYGAR